MSCCDDEGSVAVFDFDASRNESFLATVNFKGLDLTGYSARMQVRQYEGAPDPAFVTVTTAGATPNGSLLTIIAASDTLSQISVVINQRDLAAIPEKSIAPSSPDCLVYDLLLIAPDGIGQVYLKGAFSLTRGVTQPA